MRQEENGTRGKENKNQQEQQQGGNGCRCFSCIPFDSIIIWFGCMLNANTGNNNKMVKWQGSTAAHHCINRSATHPKRQWAHCRCPALFFVYDYDACVYIFCIIYIFFSNKPLPSLTNSQTGYCSLSILSIYKTTHGTHNKPAIPDGTIFLDFGWVWRPFVASACIHYKNRLSFNRIRLS